MTTKPKKEDPIAYIRSNYGYLAGFLDIPELRKVLLTAAAQKYDMGKLQGAIYATKWWKQTAEVTRQWTALVSTDPATANQRIGQTRAQIRQLAQQSGVRLSDAQLTQFSYAVNKYGWSPQQVQNAVGHQFHYDPAKAAVGQAQVTLDKLKGIAQDYLIPVSNATLQKWTQDVLAGNVDAESFTGYAQQQAKSRWPGLAAAIDRGVTVKQYTDTYRETIAQALEIDPDSIDLASPKWSKVIDQMDPKTGTRTAMTLSDAATYARSQPEFAHTAQARQQSAQLIGFLGKTFGEVAS